MEKQLIGKFCVDQSMSNTFGNASGDLNPLHIDPIVARRYQFGSPVIHGVCGTLMALDIFSCKSGSEWEIDRISVLYSRPIRQGDMVEVFLQRWATGENRIELVSHDRRCQLIKLYTVKSSNSGNNLEDIDCDNESCVELSFDQARTIDATLNLIWNYQYTRDLFPNLCGHIPHRQICLLLGLTNIVGMKCPGLNSIFGGFDLQFNQHEVPFSQQLSYRVTSADARFSRIIISIENEYASGSIEALFRAQPVQQPHFSDIQSIVKVGQFVGQKALVVGGSRGIGEVTAKVIAAGGGEVCLTYAKGQKEAESVVREITRAGGKASTIQLDVSNIDSEKFVSIIGEKITNLYYFASPLIEKSDSLTFNNALFGRFCRYYIEGFTSLIGCFMSDPEYRKQGITLFVPSTSFLDELPNGFSEYTAAKSAVETFARQFSKQHPSWLILTPRLPRLPTDQTASVSRQDPMKTAELMMQLLTSGADL